MSDAATFLVPVYAPASSDAVVPGLAYNPHHADEASALLIQQFDTAAKLHELVRILVEPLQELERVAFDVRDAFDVETAFGAQLDLVGGFVGVPRDDRGDVAYRAYIKAQILAHASDGAVETILSVARALVGASGVSLTYVPGWVDMQPAHFSLQIATTSLRFPWDPSGTVSSEVVAKAVADAVFLAIAAGVSFSLFYQYTADADTLLFSSIGDAEESSVAQGLADVSETGPGGALIGVEERY